MPTKAQAFSDRIAPYWLLLRISFLSALLIAVSPAMAFFTNCSELVCLVPLVLAFGGQWLLVIPATLIVNYIYKRQLSYPYSLSDIHPVIRVGIPLMLNIVGASSIVIVGWGILPAVSGFMAPPVPTVSPALILTIKEEAIVPSGEDFPYAYRVVLRVRNTLRDKLPGVTFTLSTMNRRYVKDYYSDYVTSILGEAQNDIPAGRASTVVTIPILGKNLKCEDISGKQLYLAYGVNNEYKTLSIGDQISAELQKIVCNSTP